MLRFIRGNCWLFLLRTLAGLHMLNASPTGLMDSFGFEAKGLRYLLHSMKVDTKLGFDALQKILQHRKFPLRELYASGCGFLMDLDRIKEVSFANSHFLGNSDSSLLSPECITRLPKITGTILNYVKGVNILTIFPPDQVSPIYFDETLLVDEIISASNLDQDSIGQEHCPSLLQNCNWFYYGRASSDLHKRSSFMTFASRAAWQAFHHSCYQCDRYEGEGIVKRLQQSIKSLVSDDPVMLIHFSLLKNDQIVKVIRWCVHLALIMTTNMQVKDGRGLFVVDPIRDYFDVLKRKLMWVRKSALKEEPLWILKKILKAALNMHRNVRVATAGLKLSSSFLAVNLPDFSRVKELALSGVPTEEARNRFNLDLVLLYSRFDENFLGEEAQEESTFVMATPIEKWQIISEHLESVKKHLDSLRKPMIHAIRGDWRLQRRLLNHFASGVSYRSHRTFQFLVQAVPFEARARFARYRFMKNSKQLRRLRFICGNRAISSRIEVYFRSLVSKDCFCKVDATHRVVLMKTQKLQLLSFMVNTAFIFHQKIPVRIDPKQLKLLLGYHEGSIYSFEGPGYDVKDYFDHSEGQSDVQDEKSHNRIADAIAMSQSMVPVLFTWSEFISIVQPEQPGPDN